MKTQITLLLCLILSIVATQSGFTEEKVVRLGIIGLDTSHVKAFTEFINNPENSSGCKVVAAYPGGSPDLEESATRVDKFTQTLKEDFKVEIVDSIEKLCKMVDGILLESVDGRVHLEQVKPVFEAGLPVFIDKPIAGNLSEALEIFKLAESHNVPCWSSSSLRYSSGIIGMRNNEKVGEVMGCSAFGSCSTIEHHPDLYWYGIHGIEILFTIMGPGCESVSRTHTENCDYVVGVWNDGRIGTYRGIRKGKAQFGAMVYGLKGIERSGEYEGYVPLVKEIIKYFKTGEVPVPHEETIEIYAFMDAADESKNKGGIPVSIKDVIEKSMLK